MEHILSEGGLVARQRHPGFQEALNPFGHGVLMAPAWRDLAIEDDRVNNGVKSFVIIITIN
jgi:hypothetical protein